MQADPGARKPTGKKLVRQIVKSAAATLATLLLFWPIIDKVFGSVGQLWRPAKASG